MDSRFLQHWGVLGMQWGKRKAHSGPMAAFRNEHGTLVKKPISEMTDAELKRVTQRLQLEKQLKDLNKKNLEGGKKFISDVLVNAGKQVATEFVAKALKSGGEAAIQKIFHQVAQP